MFETFEHTADLGLRVRAASIEELFEEAARGLTSVFIDNAQDVRRTHQVSLEIAGTELDYLLLDWLNELLFQFEHHRQIFAEFHVRLSAEGLTAEVEGEPFDAERHRALQEVKAITYHNLRVWTQDGVWVAEVIVDL